MSLLLCRGIILVTFRTTGEVPEENERSNNSDNWFEIYLLSNFAESIIGYATGSVIGYHSISPVEITIHWLFLQFFYSWIYYYYIWVDANKCNLKFVNLKWLQSYHKISAPALTFGRKSKKFYLLNGRLNIQSNIRKVCIIKLLSIGNGSVVVLPFEIRAVGAEAERCLFWENSYVPVFCT